MKKNNTNNQMMSILEDNELYNYKKSIDMTPIIENHHQNKQISVSAYRLEDRNNNNTSINQQIRINRSEINLNKMFVYG